MIETFHKPLWEVQAQFTKSELAVFAWRSREMGHNMASKTRKPHHGAANAGNRPSFEPEDLQIGMIEAQMGGVAEKATTPDGDIDLGLLTGPEACKYMSALGIVMGGRA